MKDLTAATEADALEQLHDMGCTDGLPVVIPTPERVARMVLAAGLDADMVLGTMGPANGQASIEKIAVNAVMAGCLPDHLPVVIAAVQAVMDPRFDLTEMQATTHCTAPLLIVNGPAISSCGNIASGFGALGPGHRANASIGRALRLCMINIGGGRAGSSDMALLGHPGKFTYCIAEAEHASPFDPLHVSMGFNAADSVATVIGAEAPHSVIFSADADQTGNGDKLLSVLAMGLSSITTNNAMLTGGSAVVILNPEHAAMLADEGYGRASIQQALWEKTHVDPSLIHELGAGLKKLHSHRTAPFAAYPGPESFVILVAGGGGLYSMIMPTWSTGGHGNIPVSVPIASEQYCELPGR